jgi:hypothetical protein
MDSAAYFRVTGPKIVHEVFDDEVLIVNLNTGSYYSVGSIAAEIWTRIDGETVNEIVDDLTGRYGTGEHEVAPSVMRYLDELQREGLIVPTEALRQQTAEQPGAPPHARAGQGQFQAPALRKFDDMKELLLLDPIHDFDDAGWPMAKPAEPPKR